MTLGFCFDKVYFSAMRTFALLVRAPFFSCHAQCNQPLFLFRRTTLALLTFTGSFLPRCVRRRNTFLSAFFGFDKCYVLVFLLLVLSAFIYLA